MGRTFEYNHDKAGMRGDSGTLDDAAFDAEYSGSAREEARVAAIEKLPLFKILAHYDDQSREELREKFLFLLENTDHVAALEQAERQVQV